MKWDISHFNQYTSVLVEILVFREEGGADLEMLRYLIFVMSLSGSVIVVLYKLFAPIARRFFPQSWRSSILKMALIFYLVPVPIFKDFLVSHIQSLFPFPFELFEATEFWRIDPEYTINMQSRQFFLGVGVILIHIFALCMAVIAFIVIVKQLQQYQTVRCTYLLDTFTEAPPPQFEEWLLRTKEELQVKGNIKIICSKLCDTPITIGVFSPVIIFPALNKLDLEPTDYQYILKHELIHIKNKDLLVKFLTLLALAIHWYNPICYLLYYELCVVSELNCDYGVVKGTDDVQRQRYSHLILNLATAGSSKKERFAVGLVNNDTATFERRILEMKQIRKNSKPVLSCIVMAIFCVVGTIPAFAYQAPIRVETKDSWAEYDEVVFTEHDFDVAEPLMYDYFFIGQNGNIIPLDNTEPRIGCKHNFVDGYVKKHKKNSDGSCVVKTYECSRCDICGYSIEGAFVSETKYAVCPH